MIILSNENWIPTEWTHKSDELGLITIHRMTSCYYEGVRYAVRNGDKICLSIKGKWEIEPLPSSRDKKFFEEFRFKTFESACKMAEKVMKKNKTCNVV